MPLKITGTQFHYLSPITRLPDKHFRIPGVVLKDTCPVCGTAWTWDMKEQYLSYPRVGEPIPIYAYCVNDDCLHEWEAGSVILKITLELAPEKSG